MRTLPRLAISLLGLLALCSPAVADDDFLRRLTETHSFQLGRPTAFKVFAGEALFLRTPGPRDMRLELWRIDGKSGDVSRLLGAAELLGQAPEQLSEEERARRERQRLTASGITAYDATDDGRRLLVTAAGKLFLFDRDAAAAARLHPLAEHVLDARLSPDGKHVAYARERDLWVVDLPAGKPRRLTSSSDPLVTNGQAEFAAQEEMGRMAGFWWSPDSTQLAFEEADARGLETFHLSDGLRPEQPPHATPYPRAGHNNALVRLGLIDINRRGAKPTWVRWDDVKMPYLASVVWSKGAPLTLVVQDRAQRHLEVLAVEPRGQARTLLSEDDAAWLNLDQSVPRWTTDGSAFVWASERSGGWALELRDKNGKLERELVAQAGGYRKLTALAADQAWFEGGADPTERHLYRVPLAGGGVERMTSAPQLFAAAVAKDGGAWAVETGAPDSMPRATFALKGGAPLPVPSLAETPNLAPTTTYLTVGDQHWNVAVTRPRGAAAGHKLPVLVDVYGGPHALQVEKSMGKNLMRQWMADRGFIVVAIDGRGTPGRGRDWERAIAGDFAGVTLDDQVAALRATAARVPDIDLQRVGIYGWSFGGYMAALAVLKRPDVFHAAAAGAPVVDWRDYDTHYTERYLGMPDKSAAAYDKSSLLTYAPALKRPLLIIHGTRDDNVYFFHTLKLCDALLRAGRRFDLLPLPGFTHMVPDPVVREALQRRIVDAFTRALSVPAAS